MTGPKTDVSKVIPLTPTTEEHAVWLEVVAPQLRESKQNVYEICAYGFTEMLNNAIDHSGAAEAKIRVQVDQDRIEMWVSDRGVGLFNKIRAAFGFPSDHEALLRLSKGRLTTDPERHTGEGIFFTARMFDSFVLNSGQSSIVYLSDGGNWVLEDLDSSRALSGTSVRMSIEQVSMRSAEGVFDRYARSTEMNAFEFDKTMLGIRLAQSGGELLVSRSQAKRLLSRLEKFREVILDFEGVTSIGPAFADEVFRVYANEHPDTSLLPVNATEDVMRVILRAMRRNGDTKDEAR